MRRMTTLVACMAISVGALSGISHAQTLAESPINTETIWLKIKGSWNQTKGTLKEQWGRLTDDDLLEIEGRREQLIGRLQVRYGYTREQAERAVESWERERGDKL